MKNNKNKNITKKRKNTKGRKNMLSRKGRGFFWSSKPKNDPCAMLKETIDDQESYIKDLLKRIDDLKKEISRNTGFNSRVEKEPPKRISSTDRKKALKTGVMFNTETKDFDPIQITPEQYFIEGKIIR